MKTYRPAGDAAGFSVAELALVLLIIAVLTAGGGYYRQRSGYRQQLSDTASQLHLFLAGVRENANRTHRDLPLRVRQTADGWCIDASPSPAPGDCQTRGRFVWQAPYPQVALLAVNGQPGFYGRRSVALAGSIEFGQPRQAWRIIISARARIRVCQPAQEGCQ